MPAPVARRVAATSTRVVADPDDVPVAVQHPVLRRRRSSEPPADVVGLAREHPLAVVGVQPLSHRLRVGAPFVGRVAEDRLDLRADVVPATVVAGVRDVDDRGQLVEQLRSTPA